MTRKAWFCYEQDQSNQPVPVIFYDEIPTSAGKRKILQSWEIPEEIAETLSFKALQDMYPYFSQQETLQYTTNPVVSEQMETQMTRPVEGFLTSQGKFFESKLDADLYEARYNLNSAIAKAAFSIGVVGQDNINHAVETFVGFINSNTEVIEAYIFARRCVETTGVVDKIPTVENEEPSVDGEDKSEG